MNKRKYLILVLVIAILFVIIYGVYFYNEKNKMAYVNNEEIITQYIGMQNAKKEFDKKQQEWGAKIEQLKSQLDVMIYTFAQDSAALNESEKNGRLQHIRYKQDEYIKYCEEIEKKANKEEQEMAISILSEIDYFIKQYAEKNNYDFILGVSSAGNVVYAKETHDLTEEIIEELNQGYDQK